MGVNLRSVGESALYENLRIEDEILQYHGAIVRCTAKELHKAKFGAAKVK